MPQPPKPSVASPARCRLTSRRWWLRRDEVSERRLVRCGDPNQRRWRSWLRHSVDARTDRTHLVGGGDGHDGGRRTCGSAPCVCRGRPGGSRGGLPRRGRHAPGLSAGRSDRSWFWRTATPMHAPRPRIRRGGRICRAEHPRPGATGRDRSCAGGTGQGARSLRSADALRRATAIPARRPGVSAKGGRMRSLRVACRWLCAGLPCSSRAAVTSAPAAELSSIP